MAMANCRECGAEVSSQAKTCPKCGIRKPIRRRSKLLWGIGAVMVVIAITHLAKGMIEKGGSQPATVEPAEKPSEVEILNRDPETVLKILQQTSYLIGSTSIMRSNIAVKNTLSFAVKDLKFICANYGASGTELPASVAIVYEIIKAGQTRTFRDVDFGFRPYGAKGYKCIVGGATALE